jgi:hypothetical protein
VHRSICAERVNHSNRRPLSGVGRIAQASMLPASARPRGGPSRARRSQRQSAESTPKAPGYGPPYTSRLSFSANRSLISEASARATFLYEKGFKRPFLFRDTSITMGKVDCFGFQGAWEHLGGEIAGTAEQRPVDSEPDQ